LIGPRAAAEPSAYGPVLHRVQRRPSRWNHSKKNQLTRRAIRKAKVGACAFENRPATLCSSGLGGQLCRCFCLSGGSSGRLEHNNSRCESADADAGGDQPTSSGGHRQCDMCSAIEHARYCRSGRVRWHRHCGARPGSRRTSRANGANPTGPRSFCHRGSGRQQDSISSRLRCADPGLQSAELRTGVHPGRSRSATVGSMSPALRSSTTTWGSSAAWPPVKT